MRWNSFVYVFEKPKSWFFVYYVTRRLLESKTVQNRLSAAVYDTGVNAIVF